MKIWSAKPTWRRASWRSSSCCVGVLGVDQRQDRVEQVALGDLVVHEEGLRHRAGVGQAGGLDHDAVEVELALALLLGQVGSVARRSSRIVQQTQPLFIWMICSLAVGDQDLVVDVLLAELVLDDGDLLAVRLGQHALEQRGLARAEEAGEDGGGDEAMDGAGPVQRVGAGAADGGGETVVATRQASALVKSPLRVSFGAPRLLAARADVRTPFSPAGRARGRATRPPPRRQAHPVRAHRRVRLARPRLDATS